MRKQAFLQIRVHATRLQRLTRLQTQLAIKKLLIFIYAYSFNIHICIGDQIHLYHLLSNFTAISHYSMCFYCLNSMFTKSIYCHMYVHRYGSIYWCVSSPSEPESLKNTDILPQQVSTARTSSERGGTSRSPPFILAGILAGLILCRPSACSPSQ